MGTNTMRGKGLGNKKSWGKGGVKKGRGKILMPRRRTGNEGEENTFKESGGKFRSTGAEVEKQLKGKSKGIRSQGERVAGGGLAYGRVTLSRLSRSSSEMPGALLKM